VKQIVVASSDKAYGDHDNLPYDEGTPLQGRHPYDVSKSCSDLIAQSYATTYGLPVVVTRCGNFYGGGDLNWNRIVPGTVRSVLRGQRPIIRTDGSYIRDYFMSRTEPPLILCWPKSWPAIRRSQVRPLTSQMRFRFQYWSWCNRFSSSWDQIWSRRS